MSKPFSPADLQALIARSGRPAMAEFPGGWLLGLDPFAHYMPLLIDHPGGRVRLRPFPVLKPGPIDPDMWEGGADRYVSFSEPEPGRLNLQIQGPEVLINLADVPFTRDQFLEYWQIAIASMPRRI